MWKVAMPKKIIQVPIDPELLSELDCLARARGVSRSQLIRESCESYARAARDEELDRDYVRGYTKHPEKEGWGRMGEAILAESTADEEW